jgi:hypothetical protein
MYVRPVPLVCSLLLATNLPAQDARIRELGPLSPASSASSQGPSAATASYALFGDSCGTTCASLNATRGPGRTGTLPNQYAFGHQFAQPTVIVGFQLYTRTNTLPIATMACEVYRESTTPNVPDSVPVARGSMTVTNTLDFYSVFLDLPMIVAAGEKIWISQGEATNILAAGVTSGTAPAIPSYYRRTGINWTPSVIVTYPSWRILCGNDLAFSASGVPKLGGMMTLNVHAGPANTAALLFIGATNPNVPVFCTSLYASPTIMLVTTTNANGTASLPLILPNDMALDGARFWNQWWMFTAALVAVGTNGGEGIAGN